MELSIGSIIAAVTIIMGQLTKKIGWVNKKYIPIQSILIGLISGLIAWVCNLYDTIPNALIYGVISSLVGCGLYDTTKCTKQEPEINNDTSVEDELLDGMEDNDE